MAAVEAYLRLLPVVRQLHGKNVWLTYDSQADVLYINFKKPCAADDSELTDDDVIIRYEGDEVVGYTVLHASTRPV